jgi:subtilisin family serine protease
MDLNNNPSEINQRRMHMKRVITIALLFVMLVVTFPTTSLAAPQARSYLIIAASNSSLPANLQANVTRAGGTITRSIPQIGIAAASSTDPAFKTKATRISGVRSVVPDVILQWIEPPTNVVKQEIGYPPNSGAGDFFFDLEWGMTAVNAPGAWNAGYLGAGARVAVLDSGIACENPDLVPNLNKSLSTSFVPGEGYCFGGGPGDFNHGTHVAGTIAAAINDWGVIGVAPEAEIVMVKVLSEVTGSGSFEGVIAGIVYAADVQADVINMSLGAIIPRRGFCDDQGNCVSAKDIAEIANAISRATSYANRHGTTVIAAAGNAALDFDHSADLIDLPAQAVDVVAVSATSPIGWGLDPNTDLDVPTSYTDYGLSVINLAAPGGDFAYPGDEVCTVGGITAPCVVFDGVMSDGQCDQFSCNFWWAAGTSMATPHVSGVAALIIGKNGDSMEPAQVRAALAASADDLGKPGKDAYYGMGRVNAYYAVR